MRTFDIPGGQATFRERHELTVGQRKRVQRATAAALSAFQRLPENITELAQQGADVKAKDLKIEITAADMARLDEVTEAALLASLASWTLASPLPTTPEGLDALNVEVYDALTNALTEMGGAFALSSPENFEPSPEQDSPFGASNGSGTPSKDSTAPLSIAKSPSTGLSTTTAGSTD